VSTHRALDALVCGYATPVRRNKVLVMIEFGSAEHIVFVDESQGAREGKILLLSACIQTYEVWAKFSDDWWEVLQSTPKINSFHVREARARAAGTDYAGWKPIDVDKKIIALTDVILRHEPHVFSCYMSINDYAETIKGVGPPDLDNAYFTCFLAILIKVAQYQKWLGITTPIDFVFDEIGDAGHEALMWYGVIRESLDPDIKELLGSTPLFRKDEAVLPLQAADLVAWHKRRRKEVLGHDIEVMASLRLDDLPGGEVHITRKDLEATAAKIAAVPGVKEARGGLSCYKQLKRNYRKKYGKRTNENKP
jgi:hypothetical protein